MNEVWDEEVEGNTGDLRNEHDHFQGSIGHCGGYKVVIRIFEKEERTFHQQVAFAFPQEVVAETP